jgi:hypothetical protein
MACVSGNAVCQTVSLENRFDWKTWLRFPFLKIVSAGDFPEDKVGTRSIFGSLHFS